MKRLIDFTNDEARKHFLKGSSYFNGDMPHYVSFEPMLHKVAEILKGGNFTQFKKDNPANFSKVNYSLISNKDGKFAWRPYELIHPVLYVSLVNLICEQDNWKLIKKRVAEFETGVVECCSAPVVSVNHQSDVAAQIEGWWQTVEQKSLIYSLEFSHLLHTDVTDCYGSIYTHSIAWAIHGIESAKKNKSQKSYLGNQIDFHIQSSRYGQTNGIPQGSVLMDFIAELVLGYVDELINAEIKEKMDIRILRYRDDYRIFSNSDEQAEEVLKIVSDKLRFVGMKLGVSKTFSCRNVVEGSIKADKIAGIELQDLGDANAKTIQKQLMRLHAFGQRHPNSGALRRLVSEFHTKISTQKEAPDDLEVQIAIATDIAYVSPATFPAVAGILSHLISLTSSNEKVRLWNKVQNKMKRVPYNGYIEIWLQRVTQATSIKFESDEPICKIVNGESLPLWECGWIDNDALKKAVDARNIVIGDAIKIAEIMHPQEIELFKQKVWTY